MKPDGRCQKRAGWSELPLYVVLVRKVCKGSCTDKQRNIPSQSCLPSRFENVVDFFQADLRVVVRNACNEQRKKKNKKKQKKNNYVEQET